MIDVIAMNSKGINND